LYLNSLNICNKIGLISNSSNFEKVINVKQYSYCMINQRFVKVLKLLDEKLRNQKIRWCLVGSASLVLQGVKIKPKDIDILTDKKGAFKINKLLKDYEINPVKFGNSELFESYLGEFEINGIKIEAMGNLKEKIDNVWVSASKRLASQKIIKLNEMEIPVSSLREQIQSYEKLGRKKDCMKIRKIKEALNNESEQSI